MPKGFTIHSLDGTNSTCYGSYRVELREAGITYLNKLGKFLSPHELECVDAKGQKQVIHAYILHTYYIQYRILQQNPDLMRQYINITCIMHIHLYRKKRHSKKIKIVIYTMYICMYVYQVITSARFVVAVGGRPTPLNCPGAEFVITSDDLFMLVSNYIHTYITFSRVSSSIHD